MTKSAKLMLVGDVMDGERITLRLELEDLDLIDSFVKKRPEFSNRSQLARIAIRAFIDGAQSSSASEEKGTRVTVDVPKAAFHVIKDMVNRGYYGSVEDAITDAIRKDFLSKEHLEEAKKKALEAHHETLEIL